MVLLQDLSCRDTFPIIDLKQVLDAQTHFWGVVILHPIELVIMLLTVSSVRKGVGKGSLIHQFLDLLKVVSVIKAI